MSHSQLQVLFLLTDYSSSIFSYKECNNLISVMTIWWGPCVKSSLVLFQKGQQHEGSPSGITALSRRRGLHNSMKLWAMPCRATQDGPVTVESSDKTWSTGGGNGKPLEYTSCENPMNCIKRQNDMTPEDELCRSESVQYGTGEEQRARVTSSRRNEAAGPKQKWHSVVDVSGGESKLRC